MAEKKVTPKAAGKSAAKKSTGQAATRVTKRVRRVRKVAKRVR